MFRALIISGAVAALSTPAFAGDVTVKLAGKTDAQIQADLRQAAAQVCREMLRGSMPSATGQMDCVRAVVADARAHMPAKSARSAD